MDEGANRQASKSQLPTPSRSRFRLSGAVLGSWLFYAAEASSPTRIFSASWNGSCWHQVGTPDRYGCRAPFARRLRRDDELTAAVRGRAR